MKYDCEKFHECQKPVQCCKKSCPEYNKKKFKIITGKKKGAKNG